MRWRGGEGRVGRNFGFLRTVFRQRVRIVPPKHRRVTGIPVGFRTCIRSFATISVRSALPLALLPRSVLVHQLRVANGRQSGPRQMQFCNRFVANIYYLTPFSEANGKKVSRKEQLKSRCRTIPIFIGIQLGPLSERDSKSPTLELCDKGLARIDPPDGCKDFRATLKRSMILSFEGDKRIFRHSTRVHNAGDTFDGLTCESILHGTLERVFKVLLATCGFGFVYFFEIVPSAF